MSGLIPICGFIGLEDQLSADSTVSRKNFTTVKNFIEEPESREQCLALEDNVKEFGLTYFGMTDRRQGMRTCIRFSPCPKSGSQVSCTSSAQSKGLLYVGIIISQRMLDLRGVRSFLVPLVFVATLTLQVRPLPLHFVQFR